MIVTCPSCTARYKIDEAKIKGRGAKITCPNCSHKFVVYREGEDAGTASADAPDAVDAPAIPADLSRRDFRQVGITWRVRKGIGLTYDFHDLDTLRSYITDGQVNDRDVISYDAREWTPVGRIPSLEAFFWDVWKRAEAGQIDSPAGASPAEESEDEDASDAPTTIVGHGTSLADEIRKAVHAPTPPPPERVEAQSPPAPAPAEATEAKPAAPAPKAAPAVAKAGPGAQPGGGSPVVKIAGVAVVGLGVLVAVLWALGIFGTAASAPGPAPVEGAAVEAHP